jgi:glyoxylate reductase
MKKPTIILTDPFFPDVISSELKPYAKVRTVKNRQDLLKHISSADGLITRFMDPVNEELLSRSTRLRAIGNFAVGYDNIDLEACKRRGIRVTNTPHVLTRATAELAATLLMAAARRVPEGEALCRSGKFKGWRPDLLLGIELLGKTAVLVGKGRIGKETAKIFKGLGLKIEWITRFDTEASIRKKLSRAEVLSLHLPLHKDTRHWLGSQRLDYLPRGSIVVNTTRGPVVDEKALIQRLKTRKIFAAGLDVFENEPFIPRALRELPNVVLLPHLGSSTRSARRAMAQLAVSGVLAILDGQRPKNEVVF